MLDRNGLLELVEAMKAPNDDVRKVAVETLSGALVGRPFAKSQPELVPPLVDLFSVSGDPEVRSVCVQALTEFADEENPPSPLLESLCDPDSSVFLSGVFALAYFPDARALRPMCDFIDSRRGVHWAENAINALGEIGNEAAVPTLAGVLLDLGYAFAQSRITAAIALAKCGQAGFDALVSAFEQADPQVRFAAVIGIDTSENEAALTYMERATDDPDERIRERARFRAGRTSS